MCLPFLIALNSGSFCFLTHTHVYSRIHKQTPIEAFLQHHQHTCVHIYMYTYTYEFAFIHTFDFQPKIFFVPIPIEICAAHGLHHVISCGHFFSPRRGKPMQPDKNKKKNLCVTRGTSCIRYFGCNVNLFPATCSCSLKNGSTACRYTVQAVCTSCFSQFQCESGGCA